MAKKQRIDPVQKYCCYQFKPGTKVNVIFELFVWKLPRLLVTLVVCRSSKGQEAMSMSLEGQRNPSCL